jgi:sterol desaturase/sphingolipid hydroxylase (fatty acid hydroxylase superfamily)
MQLSRLGYYSDYVVYPLVITGLAAAAFAGDGAQESAAWFAAFLAGLGLWTLMEYFLHRFAFHRISLFVPMHGLHHTTPLALVGTPTWLSLTALGFGILAPAWLSFGFNVASGVTAGVMIGYLWYGFVHHVIHHQPKMPLTALFNGLRAWHLRHHYSKKSGNFGVTTTLWDRVFGTTISVAANAAADAGRGTAAPPA